MDVCLVEMAGWWRGVVSDGTDCGMMLGSLTACCSEIYCRMIYVQYSDNNHVK